MSYINAISQEKDPAKQEKLIDEFEQHLICKGNKRFFIGLVIGGVIIYLFNKRR
ncbi:MAG: hypothetical protein KKD48_01945 [Nanoarchaeota archaeon]|nr:hypothetical protein [Nanoarchaeota archaeon]